MIYLFYFLFISIFEIFNCFCIVGRNIRGRGPSPIIEVTFIMYLGFCITGLYRSYQSSQEYTPYFIFLIMAIFLTYIYNFPLPSLLEKLYFKFKKLKNYLDREKQKNKQEIERIHALSIEEAKTEFMYHIYGKCELEYNESKAIGQFESVLPLDIKELFIKYKKIESKLTGNIIGLSDLSYTDNLTKIKLGIVLDKADLILCGKYPENTCYITSSLDHGYPYHTFLSIYHLLLITFIYGLDINKRNKK